MKIVAYTEEFVEHARGMPISPRPPGKVCGHRVGLLTPYGGPNLGDAVIQDAVIANLRLRLSGLRISGICLDSRNFIERHGEDAFPLCMSNLAFYGMCHPGEEGQSDSNESLSDQGNRIWKKVVKGLLRKVPGAGPLEKTLRRYFATIRREFRHCVEAYRFVRTQELLIVSGGGQLDDEWGGPWGHPYCLFKFAVIAKCARVPFAFVSVGACKISSPLSLCFLSVALDLACYRSYRDANSRRIAAKCHAPAIDDPVVPDLAFSLPPSVFPRPAGIRSLAQGRPIVAVSPIAYAKSGVWPTQNQSLYERYKRQMTLVLSRLVSQGYFVVLIWSSLGDDDQTASELMARLNPSIRNSQGGQIHIPEITTWANAAALLLDADFLIASRLHSTILGFMTNTPVVAISFDPKVDWVMQDLGQTEVLLGINNFTAGDVLQALKALELSRGVTFKQIATYRDRISTQLSIQYDTLAKLAGGE